MKPAAARRVAFLVGLCLVPVAFFACGLLTLHDYGETSDEGYDTSIGRFYYEEYPKTGLANLDGRLDPLQRHYGAFWDVVAVWGVDVLVNKTHTMTNEIAARHVSVLFASSLLVGAVFLLGTSAYGLAAGFASQLALLLLPQFIGHSQNNLKDQPVAFFFTMSMLAFLSATRKGALWRWALAGALGGVTYAVKINGAFVLPVAGLAALPFVLRDWRRLHVWVLRFAVATVAYVAVVPILWPFYRTQTLARFFQTARAFHDHVFNEVVYYMGQHAPAREVPWHFPFVMMGISTPLLHLGLLVLSFGLLAALLVRRRLDEAGPLLLFATWFVVPIVVQVASGVPRCDGVRHYLYVLPALALMAGTAAVRLWRWAAERRLGPAALRAAAAALPVLLLVRTLVAIHPYEVVFFNALVGGPAGAARNFELDYWGTSILEASRWIDRNLPKGARLWFTQPGIHRFVLAPERVLFVNGRDRPNYKVSLIRGMTKTYDTDDDYLHPRRKPIYQVTALGAPLLQIFEMEENRDVANGTALAPGTARPAREAPGLEAVVSVDNLAFERMPVQMRLSIDCDRNPYFDKNVEIQAAGFLRVTASGPHVFTLFSDDVATVWLGADAVVTNVSTLTTRKTVVLAPGLYPIRVKLRNELGKACFALSWQPPGAARPSEVAAPSLVHDEAASVLTGLLGTKPVL